MPRKMRGTEYFQATDTNLLFRDVSLYTETISSTAQAPAVIALEAEQLGIPAYYKAFDFPNPDYVALAHACGAVGFKAEKPGALRDAIDPALKADGSAIVACVVPVHELPNLPHLEPELIANYAKAKLKEEILAFTGG